MKGSVNGKCGKMCSITTKFGGGNKKNYMHMGFQFGDYNSRIEGVSYQKIGIMGLALIQVVLGIVLKID